MSGHRKVVSDDDHDGIYDIIGYLLKLRIIWNTSLLKKENSGPLNDTFDFIPLHLTFQGDVQDTSCEPAQVVLLAISFIWQSLILFSFSKKNIIFFSNYT